MVQGEALVVGVMKKEAMETLSGLSSPMRPIREEDLTEVEDPTMVVEVDMVIIEDPILAI